MEVDCGDDQAEGSDYFFSHRFRAQGEILLNNKLVFWLLTVLNDLDIFQLGQKWKHLEQEEEE